MHFDLHTFKEFFMITFRTWTVATFLGLGLLSSAQADIVTDWNEIALRATVSAGLPPPPQTRAMALVHAAIYDAVNNVERRHASGGGQLA
jgi:hypothetical protein